MKNKIIATESFSSKGRHFFLDFMIAKNDTNYISITRSDEQQDGSYDRACSAEHALFLYRGCGIVRTTFAVENGTRPILVEMCSSVWQANISIKAF